MVNSQNSGTAEQEQPVPPVFGVEYGTEDGWHKYPRLICIPTIGNLSNIGDEQHNRILDTLRGFLQDRIPDLVDFDFYYGDHLERFRFQFDLTDQPEVIIES